MALGLTLGIGRSMRIKRSPSLDILTSNLRTPPGYYQANSHLKPTGFLTSKGGYVIHPQKLPNYVVPDLTGFKLKPYLSHMAIKATNPAESTTKYMLGTVSSSYTSLGGTSHRNVYRRTFGYDYRGFMSNQGCRLKKSYNLHNLGSVTSIRQYSTVNASIENKSKKMLFYLTGLVFGMVGLSYAAVPLYRRFCQATGYGGTIQRRESVEEKIARHAKDGTTTSREIVVQFNADVSDGMPWKFTATQREVRVKPGESALAFYTAENRSSNPITGMSTYNVTPMKAAVYFNKIQCFCFEEQKLLPGEQIDMPVFFYIDPEFETDPKMDGINNIILSYTFFKVSGDQ